MRSIYKKLKRVLILLAIVVSLFNSIYACRTAIEILDDCTNFYNEPPQQQGFISKEEACRCVEQVNELLRDIEKFCTFSTDITSEIIASRSWLRAQEAPLKLKRAEAQLYLHPKDKKAFEFLKVQAKMGNLDLRPYLVGGKLEGSLSGNQIDELLTILSEGIDITDRQKCVRFDLIIQKALDQHLSEQVKRERLQIEEVKKLQKMGFLKDYEVFFWLGVLAGMSRQDT